MTENHELLIRMGRTVQMIRKNNGISLRKTARQVKMSPLRLWLLENGLINTGAQEMFDLCCVLNIGIDRVVAIAEIGIKNDHSR